MVIIIQHITYKLYTQYMYMCIYVYVYIYMYVYFAGCGLAKLQLLSEL